MIHFMDWTASRGAPEPWCILGKGPSFSRHADFPELDGRYRTFGLNHVCRERKVFLAHAIDANVLDEVPEMPSRAEWLAMPMHPHFKFKPSQRTLEEIAHVHPVAKEFEARGRLVWYDLNTWPQPRRKPVVNATFFSAEAATHLLALAGVKRIRTLGIDGGSSYAGEFKDIKPFRGGHKTFDLQNGPIRAVVKKFKIDFAPMQAENF